MFYNVLFMLSLSFPGWHVSGSSKSGWIQVLAHEGNNPKVCFNSHARQ